MTKWEAEDWLLPVTYVYNYNPSFLHTKWEAIVIPTNRRVNETVYARNKKSLDKKVTKLINKKRKMARQILDLSGIETIS